MRTCLHCGKPLNRQQKKFCSSKCCAEYRSNKIIQDWLDGKTSGCNAGVYGELKHSIRAYILKQANYQCAWCGWGKTNPYTGLISLEVHHKDGNHRNNRPENLEVICPCCHSLTPNYKAANRNGTRKNRVGVKKEKVKRVYHNDKVSREELKDLIRTTPFVQIGKRFGVTDSAVRKWCKKYQLPYQSTIIHKITDDKWECI